MGDNGKWQEIFQWIIDLIKSVGSWTFQEYALFFGVVLGVLLVTALVVLGLKKGYRLFFPSLKQNKKKQFTTKGLKRRWR